MRETPEYFVLSLKKGTPIVLGTFRDSSFFVYTTLHFLYVFSFKAKLRVRHTISIYF